MIKTGLCHVCGKPTTLTCRLCGKPVCKEHLDSATGICTIHKTGRRISK